MHRPSSTGARARLDTEPPSTAVARHAARPRRAVEAPLRGALAVERDERVGRAVLALGRAERRGVGVGKVDLQVGGERERILRASGAVVSFTTTQRRNCREVSTMIRS